MTSELEDAGEGITDNGASQVTDVHILGNVGRRVIDDNALLLDGRRDHTTGEDLLDVFADPFLVEVEVDKAGSSDFELANESLDYGVKGKVGNIPGMALTML